MKMPRRVKIPGPAVRRKRKNLLGAAARRRAMALKNSSQAGESRNSVDVPMPGSRFISLCTSSCITTSTWVPPSAAGEKRASSWSCRAPLNEASSPSVCTLLNPSSTPWAGPPCVKPNPMSASAARAAAYVVRWSAAKTWDFGCGGANGARICSATESQPASKRQDKQKSNGKSFMQFLLSF